MGKGLYLYTSSKVPPKPGPESVFYKAEDAETAETICRLCTKEYTTTPECSEFFMIPADELPLDEQILLDEALDRISLYDDPDPTVYDPMPSKAVLTRAQYAMRAKVWEDMLAGRRQRGGQNAGATVGQYNHPQTVEEALCSLQRVVEKHRLTFLYFARPERRNPANLSSPRESLDQDQLPDGRIPAEAIDSAGEFLFKYRWHLERFAQTAVSQFGPGVGANPTEYRDGTFVEVEGGSRPMWLLDDISCIYLEQSADAILDACKAMTKVDTRRQYQALVKKARQTVHDEGQAKWYASVLVRWEYLSRLDRLITDIKAAEIDIDDIVSVGEEDESAVPPLPNPSNSEGRSIGVKPPQATDAEATPSPQPVDKVARECLKPLALALQELRAAAQGVLTRPEPAGSYPKPQIETYRLAIDRANVCVADLIEQFDAQGEIEARIRDGVGTLASTMDRVIDKCDGGIGPDGIEESVAEPVREALKALMALELTVAMMTLTSDEMQMPVEDRRISGLVLLILLAQAYYQMLESTISMANWCTVLDLELNQSYLWVTASLTKLLGNDEDLRDFPTKFEPLFPDLYPSTIRDVDWHDMVAPDAEAFLSTVQKYVLAKGMYEPAKGSTAWTFVEMFRPGVDTAIERASAYNKRMRKYAHKLFGDRSAEKDGSQATEAGTRRADAMTKSTEHLDDDALKDPPTEHEGVTAMSNWFRRGAAVVDGVLAAGGAALASAGMHEAAMVTLGGGVLTLELFKAAHEDKTGHAQEQINQGVQQRLTELHDQGNLTARIMAQMQTELRAAIEVVKGGQGDLQSLVLQHKQTRHRIEALERYLASSPGQGELAATWQWAMANPFLQSQKALQKKLAAMHQGNVNAIAQNLGIEPGVLPLNTTGAGLAAALINEAKLRGRLIALACEVEEHLGPP